MENPRIIDLHEDLLLHINHLDLWGGKKQTSYEQLRKNGVRITFATAFPFPPEENYFNPITNDLIEQDFKDYVKHCETNPEWQLIKNASDLQAVIDQKNKTAIIMHIEGLNIMRDVAEDWARLDRWHALGWRSLGIVWNLTNSLGGGTKDPVQGLTPLGKKMIEWLEKRRMVIDFAHMNAPTFKDASRLVKGPILVSHGNACTICQNPRNYTDEQLKRVAASNGVVGTFFAKTFLTGDRPAEINDVVEHITHLKKVMGIDHVA
ncbi:MAG: membrane dipeptidase, partial [bacterium]|nr:membrane dipeptidase [bacterium]